MGQHWFSKITHDNYVDAQQICRDQVSHHDITYEYGDNGGLQCKYPGDKYGYPNQVGSINKLGLTVSWRCGRGTYYVKNLDRGKGIIH